MEECSSKMFRGSAKRTGISSSNLSRMPIIGVRSELRIPMHQNAHHNTIHSFILGIGFIGYEIGL
jgi:hypothetical protein